MQHLSGLERARSALEKGHRFPAGALTPLVAQSWERCIEIGLDPLSQSRDLVIPFGDVKRKREEHVTLRRLALAEMQLLYSQIAGSNFMIAFADREGVVLDTISDQCFADSVAGRSIIPGSLWDESQRGTNALGVAARERAPVAIYGREHYFSCHGHLSCMAAPIFDPGGNVLGLLDASCSNEARQQHTHALVRMAAAQIENGLIYQERLGAFIFAFHPRIEYLDTLSAGLIAVSREGKISSLNRPGTALLAGLPARVGAHFDDLFEAGFGPTIDGMMNGGVIRLRDRAGSGVFMVCRQIGVHRESFNPSAPAKRPRILASRNTPHFVCEDVGIKRQMHELADAVAIGMPIHIFGPTGTGKELMAKHVHRLSGRTGEFVAINCGAIPESLFIAELFGYARGAFTNAHGEGSPGLVRIANNGTLFLDEVADIPLAAQTALLRFLDTMEVRSVGSQKTEKVDVQIVSATNADLSTLVAARSFRPDLLYRLNAFTLNLPSLSLRSDFSSIVHHIVEELAPGTAITDAAVGKLASRSWPGNIRELRAVLQRALVRSQAGYIDENSLDRSESETTSDCCADCSQNRLSQQKCRAIRSTYLRTDGNVSETARLLGISRTTVYKHLGL